jgi:exonuclease SbcD
MAHTASVIKELNLKHTTIIDEPQAVEVNGIHFCFIPYLYRQRLNKATNVEVLKYYADTIKDFQEQSDRAILIGHQTIEGTSFSSGYVADLSTLNEIVIPQKFLKGFEASFFGHIHKHQILSKEPLIIIPGSIEHIDFGEVGNRCGFVVYDTEKKKWKHVQTPNVDLHLFEVDLTEIEEDLTQHVLDSIDWDKVRGSIVKLHIKVKETDVGRLDCGRVKKELDAKAQFCPGIKMEVVKNRVTRNEKINESISVKDALKEYITGCENYKDISEEMLKEGLDIVRLCDVNWDTKQ